MRKKAKIEIEINCNPTNCGGCFGWACCYGWSAGRCAIFNKKLRLTGNRFSKRCAECIKQFGES